MDSDSITSLLGSIHIIQPTWDVVLSGVLAILLLGGSGFISASEIAFFSLEPNDMKEVNGEKHSSDRQIIELLKRTDRLLATILIANNFVNVAVVMLLNYFFLSTVKFGDSYLMQFLFQTVVLTFLLLLFGEIMPKIYATHNSLAFARRSAGVLSVLQVIFKPISSILVASTNMVNKSIVRKNINISMDELSHALELTSHEIKDEKDILEGIINFGDKVASEVMTSRIDMCALEVGVSFGEVIDFIKRVGYSRIPVYESTQDSIKGLLYIKDLLPYIDSPDNFKWQTLVRPAYFVPETKKIDTLLEEFQSQKIHMAVVVDEYGGTAGIVTLEDVLEEIVGEISDEFDVDERSFVKLDDTTYIFEAKILLADFFRITAIDEREFEAAIGEADTLAGFILEIKGEFPTRKEVIRYDKYLFQIVEMDKRRIVRVKFSYAPSSVQS
ncbi:MAG: gliding motility-associated protein GldE [Bacteroidales bacterium]